MSKSLAVAAFLSLSLVGVLQAHELPKSPAQVAQAFEKHFNAGDVEGLMRLYARDAVFVPAPGVQLSEPAQIRGALKQFLAAQLPIKVTIRQVYRSKGSALIVSDWAMAGAGPDGKPVDMSGTGADVVTERADGTWRYAIDNPFGVALPK